MIISSLSNHLQKSYKTCPVLHQVFGENSLGCSSRGTVLDLLSIAHFKSVDIISISIPLDRQRLAYSSLPKPGFLFSQIGTYLTHTTIEAHLISHSFTDKFPTAQKPKI